MRSHSVWKASESCLYIGIHSEVKKRSLWQCFHCACAYICKYIYVYTHTHMGSVWCLDHADFVGCINQAALHRLPQTPPTSFSPPQILVLKTTGVRVLYFTLFITTVSPGEVDLWANECGNTQDLVPQRKFREGDLGLDVSRNKHWADSQNNRREHWRWYRIQIL